MLQNRSHVAKLTSFGAAGSHAVATCTGASPEQKGQRVHRHIWQWSVAREAVQKLSHVSIAESDLSCGLQARDAEQKPHACGGGGRW